jgi:hypothetical protein
VKKQVAMNELILEKSWWKRNWKWFIPSVIVLSTFAIILSLFASPIPDIAKAYADNSIHENALVKARQNQQVTETLGVLEPIDKMAIFEGFVLYSNNNNTVNLTIRVKGTKGKGKMDITANKVNENWSYQKIAIRIKEPKKTISIIQK